MATKWLNQNCQRHDDNEERHTHKHTHRVWQAHAIRCVGVQQMAKGLINCSPTKIPVNNNAHTCIYACVRSLSCISVRSVQVLTSHNHVALLTEYGSHVVPSNALITAGILAPGDGQTIELTRRVIANGCAILEPAVCGLRRTCKYMKVDSIYSRVYIVAYI